MIASAPKFDGATRQGGLDCPDEAIRTLTLDQLLVVQIHYRQSEKMPPSCGFFLLFN
jgi:hypothetical protein